MKNKFFRIKNKIRKNNGFSITEMMVTCVLFVLISGMLVTGTKAGLKVYKDSSSVSQGQILCSTIASLVKDELRYTGSMTIDSDGQLISFFSQNYGDSEESTFELNEEKHVMIGDDLILSEWSYVDGLNVDNILVNYTDDKFSVKITVADASGNIVAEEEFEVKPVNDIDITIE